MNFGGSVEQYAELWDKKLKGRQLSCYKDYSAYIELSCEAGQ
jgi:hypothetical protein